MCSCEIRDLFFPLRPRSSLPFIPGGAFLSPCFLQRQSRLAIFLENICDVRGLPSSPRPLKARRNVKIHRLFFHRSAPKEKWGELSFRARDERFVNISILTDAHVCLYVSSLISLVCNRFETLCNS